MPHYEGSRSCVTTEGSDLRVADNKRLISVISLLRVIGLPSFAELPDIDAMRQY